MSASPMTTGPQLAGGERLVSLEEAARLLRVSVATLQARMIHEFGSAGPGATRHLTSRQLDLRPRSLRAAALEVRSRWMKRLDSWRSPRVRCFALWSQASSGRPTRAPPFLTETRLNAVTLSCREWSLERPKVPWCRDRR